MHPFHVLVIQVFRQIKELKNKTLALTNPFFLGRKK